MTFNLREGEFLFQDGTWVKTTQNVKLEARSFKDAWTDMDKPFKVFLGLRRWDQAGTNVAPRGAHDERRRYIEETAGGMRDRHGVQQVEITFLDHLSGFWEGRDKLLPVYPFIPLPVLTLNGQDVVFREFVAPAVTLAASDRYSPSCATIGAYPFIVRILEEVQNRGGSESPYLQAEYPIFPRLPHAQPHARASPCLRVYTSTHFMPTPELRMRRRDQHPHDRVDALGEAAERQELILPYDHEDLFLLPAGAASIVVIVASHDPRMEKIITSHGQHYFRDVPQELLDTGILLSCPANRQQ
jgi:type VI secretion system protein ImpJ